ncbi:MAG: hypothetical protein ISS78_12610 [Phycisphaerae bacterium]|nr:hypothetical protein [Phycisphaerae bacterium]
MKREQKNKPFSEMNKEELAEATAIYDQEFIIDSFGPMPPEAVERLERAKKRGRPRKGEGVKVISVSMERGLLDESDAFARERNMSRSALIASALRTMIAGTRSKGSKTDGAGGGKIAASMATSVTTHAVNQGRRRIAKTKGSKR